MSTSADQWQSLKNAGQNLGIRLFAVEMRDPPYNYVAAWESVPAEYRGMLILPTSGLFFRDRQRIADFTVERRIPAMFVFREWVDAGGLVSYGASITGMCALAADYVDKLAKGGCAVRPADRAANKVSTYFEFENGQEDRPYDSRKDLIARRRGDRITIRLAALHMSQFGTSVHFAFLPATVALGAKRTCEVGVA